MIISSALARALISTAFAGLATNVVFATVATWSATEGHADEAGYRIAYIVNLVYMLPLGVFALAWPLGLILPERGVYQVTWYQQPWLIGPVFGLATAGAGYVLERRAAQIAAIASR